MRILLGFLIFILAVLIPGKAFTEETNELTPREKEELRALQKAVEEEAKSENGNFILEGIVVDEEGKPLKDVELTITTHKTIFSPSGFLGFDYKTKKRKMKIDGSFSVRAYKCERVALEFRKKGYFKEQIRFSILVARGSLPGTQEGELKGNTFINRNIRVVMERIGELPKLIRYDSYLEYYSGGKAIIIDLDKGMGDPVDGGRGIVEVEDLLSAVDMNLLPSNSIYLLPVSKALDAKGKIIPVKDKYGRLFSPRVKLVINDPEGGFVVHTPLPPQKRKASPIVREMKEAPKEGYVRKIELAPFRGRTYFYFKIGGKFGKGLVSSPAYERVRKYNPIDSVGVDIKLWLNPTGERNVRSLY